MIILGIGNKNVKSEQELVELMIQEPDWDMLQDSKVVEKLLDNQKSFHMFIQDHDLGWYLPVKLMFL